MRVYTDRGVFVAFEGGEGSGKSTQSRLLRDWLTHQGYDVVLTHEPGDTAVGQTIRTIVLSPETGELDHRAEALLYAADKAEHIHKLVIPALRRGAVVVTDRYVDSTLAYQGAGRALRATEVEEIARWATSQLRPHLTVLLDVEPELGIGRIDTQDRLEAEPMEFHQRVRQSFLALAEADSEHYLVLDARRDRQAICLAVRQRVTELLSLAERHHGVDA
ncbi:MAG: dTMP kinase [Nocardioidaceae bacterium]